MYRQLENFVSVELSDLRYEHFNLQFPGCLIMVSLRTAFTSAATNAADGTKLEVGKLSVDFLLTVGEFLCHTLQRVANAIKRNPFSYDPSIRV